MVRRYIDNKVTNLDQKKKRSNSKQKAFIVTNALNRNLSIQKMLQATSLQAYANSSSWNFCMLHSSIFMSPLRIKNENEEI